MAATVTGTPVTYALPNSGEATSTLSVTVPAGATTLVVDTHNTRFPERTPTGITFGGVALTLRDSIVNTTYVRTDGWTLDNPAASTADVVVTWDGAARGGVTARCLTGAASGAPTTAKAANSSALAVATAADGIVLSAYAIDEGDSTTIALSAGSSEGNFIGSVGAGGPSTRIGAASQAGTGGSVSTTWTPTGAGAYPAHLVMAFAGATSGPTIATQPTAQTAILNGPSADTSVDFVVAATTSGGALTYDWELETSVGGGVYANLADGSGVTWSGQAAATATAVCTATTLSGRRVRCNVTDSNGTTTTNAVALTILEGPIVDPTSGTTNGSGVLTTSLTSDQAGVRVLVTAYQGATVVGRVTTLPT